MSNSRTINYLSGYGFTSMTKFVSELETFHLARIKEGKGLEILETLDKYLVPMDKDGQDRKIRPVKATTVSLPETTIEGKVEQRVLIGDPLTIALDLLRHSVVNPSLGLFRFEKISRVEFKFENIQCEAIAVSFDESDLDVLWDPKVRVDDLWYISSLSSYLMNAKVNYNSEIGKERIDQFIKEITVDDTWEAKDERNDADYPQADKPNYYVVSSVLKSNSFRVSFNDSLGVKIGVGLILPQGLELNAGYNYDFERENTLVYDSKDNYLAFGVQLIPFCLCLRGLRSTAQPFLKSDFDETKLRQWTGEIFNQEADKKLRNSIGKI
jgi:hypothetical protein